MVITHRFTRGWTSGNGNGFSQTLAIAADGEDNRVISAAGDSTQQVALAIDVSQLKGLALLSDQDVTLKTNSSGSPANVFTLAAGVPFLWFYGDPALHDTAGTAVSTDVTTLYIVNAGDDAASVLICVLVDSTL